VIYNLLSMRSLAPPLIALVGLPNIGVGDQIILAAGRNENSQLAPARQNPDEKPHGRLTTFFLVICYSS
jgi:xanthosine utilization system XapX-like protein